MYMLEHHMHCLGSCHRPVHRKGLVKRWRDQIKKDLKSAGVVEVEWYDEATLSRGA